MKNMKKTVAAGVVGIALLAGVGGTFATWQHSDTARIGTIRTGTMSVSVDEIKDWTLSLDGNVTAYPEDIDDIYDIQLVPGNTLKGEFNVVSTLEGQDLKASFRFGVVADDESEQFDVVEIEPGVWGVEGSSIRIYMDDEDLRAPVEEGRTPRTMAVQIVFDRIAPDGDLDNLYDTEVIANLGKLQLILTQTNS